jgi:hypothetical protein
MPNNRTFKKAKTTLARGVNDRAQTIVADSAHDFPPAPPFHVFSVPQRRWGWKHGEHRYWNRWVSSAKLRDSAATSVRPAGVPADIAASDDDQGLRRSGGTLAFGRLGLAIIDTTGWNKGDILVFDGNDLVRLPIGADGQILTANSGSPTGLAWAD